MKTTTLLACCSLNLIASALLAAEAGPKGDVLAAAKALGEKPNYAWKATVVVPESAQFKPGPTDGKTEKGGFTYVMMSFGQNVTEIVTKGDKTVVTNQEGEWQNASDAESGEGRGRFVARMAKNLKAPAAQAAELADGTKDWKKDGDAYTGTLTDEGAKAQFRLGNVTGPKGSVKFWTKDGVLTKYEFKVQGKLDFNGNEIDVDRTTTVEVKEVGSTKVNVPEAAKKKLG
jgi:hypothetical protein